MEVREENDIEEEVAQQDTVIACDSIHADSEVGEDEEVQKFTLVLNKLIDSMELITKKLGIQQIMSVNDRGDASTINVDDIFSDFKSSPEAVELHTLVALQDKICERIDTMLDFEKKQSSVNEANRQSKVKNNNKSQVSHEWKEYIEDTPPPEFDLDSPVVDHILNTWTTDPYKVSYVESILFYIRESYHP